LPIMPELCLTDIQPAQLRVFFPKGITTQSHWYSGVCLKLKGNPSYLGGRDCKDVGSKPTWRKCLQEPHFNQ
jgi:hypothetical protein